ncbi:collagen alpha-4(vi) chain [Plakobranchus ocellatus]|uniref:Collagen alpha-4(Vi) chain n=1 Tax=Plakobranchus ocellatus TaxID=259542 RepID=A0AAV4BKC9_9GAST|nr:collagen alpha-4(vi) chain [Plakobranchus ocellatus]
MTSRNYAITISLMLHLCSAWAQVSPKTDVVLLIDSSDAVGPAKLASLRAFLLDLVEQWSIGPEQVQVGGATWCISGGDRRAKGEDPAETQLHDQIHSGRLESASKAINQEAVRKMILDNRRIKKIDIAREVLKKEYTISSQIFWDVSVVSYGGGIHEEFDLDDNGDLQSIKQAILRIPFRGGYSDQAEGIKYASQTSFTPGHGFRPDANQVIIHITDQAPADPGEATKEAQLVFDKGVKIYSIAVGDGTGLDKMKNTTSDPLSRYLLKGDTYSSLKTLAPVLGSRINNEVPLSSASLPAPSSCLQKADLVFVVDSSSSVGQNDFHHLEDFLKDAIVQLPVQRDNVRVGVVQYGNHPSLEFSLDVYSERLSMMKAVDGINFMGGGTNTGHAIQYTTDTLFSTSQGARNGVPHIAVVITDGHSGDRTATLAAADKARQQGVNLFAVGIGQNVNRQELQDIADDPDSDHIFQARSYKDLKTLSKQILDATCKVKTVAKTAPTSDSGLTSSAPCVDKLGNCGYYSKDTCNDYRPWAEENCARFCGFCVATQPVTPCDDKVDCSGYGPSVCLDSAYMSWNQVNCPRYCGLCHGKCFYKGVEYSQGEKWVDGCDYECVCEDGRSGAYRCYNRCPVYQDLPRECTLIAVPDQCCLRPVCDFNQRMTTTQGSGKGINAQGIDMCVYAGLQYYNGQSWEIGCDLRCTCTNAKLGTYVCQSYCPTYTSVPSNCRLVKKPGECCTTPVCEFDTLTGVMKGQGTISGAGIGVNTYEIYNTCL